MIKFLLFILLMSCQITWAQTAIKASRPIQESTIGNYDSLVSKAAIAIANQDFVQAKEYYKQATFLRPNDPFAIQMLKNIDNAQWAITQSEKRDQELKRKAKINKFLTDALKALESKKYDTARALYTLILSLNPVKSQEEFARQKIKAIDLIAGNPGVKSEIKLTDTKKIPATEKDVVASAVPNTTKQKPFLPPINENKEQDVKLKSGAENSGATIQKEVTNSSKNLTYDSLVSIAAVAISNQQFNQAKEYYQQARMLKPNDPFPIQMLKNIENALAVINKNEKRDEELRTKAEITKYLDNASIAIIDKNYESARALYNKVLSLHPAKSQEEFAKQKIKSIDLALGKATAPSVNDVSEPKKTAPKQNDIVTSTAPIVKQRSTIPVTNENKGQDVKLKSDVTVLKDTIHTEIKNKDNNLTYDSILAKAALAFYSKEFIEAKEYYKQASLLKPNDPFPLQMLKNIQNALEVLSQNEKSDPEQKRKAEINKYLDEAVIAMLSKNYESARSLYSKVLSLSPGKSQEELAKQKIKFIDLALSKPAVQPNRELSETKKTVAVESKEPASTTIVKQKNNTVRDYIPDVHFKYKPTVNNSKTQGEIDNKKSVNSKEEAFNSSKKNAGKNSSTPSVPKVIAAKPIEVGSVRPTVKTIQKSTPREEKAPGIKNQDNYDVLMDAAIKAINSKDYKEARSTYQKILALNSPKVKKEGIKIVIKAIDEVIAKEKK